MGVALGIEYDRSGVFTFLVPGVIGIMILFASWVRILNYKQEDEMHLKEFLVDLSLLK